MPRSKRMKLPEYVVELVDVGVEVLTQDHGASPERARDLMIQIAKAVCFRNASSTVYIPEADALARLDRNARIWLDYQADNPEPPYTPKFTPARAWELARQHQLSPQQVYSILRGQREQEVSERQAEIPDLAPIG